MLTVHHLGKSQSERVVWLCEELGIPYELKRYARDPVTMLAPAEYKALHPIGTAPVITDGDFVLAESGAIVDYIMAKYGNGRLALRPDHPDFAQFLYWFHFANGTLQAGMAGPGVFGGYLNDEHNKGAFVDGVWVNSGDLGRLDADGYLWITGRAKDLVIRGGHNIDPAPIEEIMAGGCGPAQTNLGAPSFSSPCLLR